MIRSRRTTRLVAALALAGFLTSSPLAPAPLSATAATLTISGTTFCEGLSLAIRFLTGQPAGRLRDFLLAQLVKLDEKYCTVVPV